MQIRNKWNLTKKTNIVWEMKGILPSCKKSREQSDKIDCNRIIACKNAVYGLEIFF